MMKVKCVSNYLKRTEADLLVLPFVQKKSKVSASFQNKTFEKWVEQPINCKDFKAKKGETFLLYPARSLEKRVLLLGLGAESRVCSETIRCAYAKLIQFCQGHEISKINLLVPTIDSKKESELLQGLSEGLFLSNYVFESLKGTTYKKKKLLSHCSFVGVDQSKLAEIKKWQTLSEGVSLARDLINDNADTMNAQGLSQEAKNLEAQFPKIKTTILDKKKLEKEKLNLILTVNRGSSVDPALIVMEYRGAHKKEKPTAIVGKGISFDAGGIQLKPRSGNIIHMKCDMSGAAAVFGILYAAAKLDLPLNIIGIIPSCENAIDSESYKPGDVYESYLGKTVEIISTDAEGRLILADAMAYAKSKYNPSQMIDLATLTGGVIAAVGDRFTGLMSNSEKLTHDLKAAAKKSGERVWELPLCEDYKEAIHSNVADLANASKEAGYPSAIVAGLFLQEFVQNTPWAHLDIAGTAYLRKPRDYHTTKATGVGVRLVIAFLEDLIES